MNSKYTLSQLEAMPTLEQGHTDDLKVDELETRVWLSRMTIEDGQPYDNQVTIEKLEPRRGRPGNGAMWITIKQYEAK